MRSPFADYNVVDYFYFDNKSVLNWAGKYVFYRKL